MHAWKYSRAIYSVEGYIWRDEIFAISRSRLTSRLTTFISKHFPSPCITYIQIVAFRAYFIYMYILCIIICINFSIIYTQYIGGYTDHMHMYLPRQEVLKEICHWGCTKTIDWPTILHNYMLYYHTVSEYTRGEAFCVQKQWYRSNKGGRWAESKD